MSGAIRRITVVGIDGCGKSSFMQQLRERTSQRLDFTTITCPDFHDTRNSPLADLSRQLKAFSDAADVIGRPVVKASALYLQMTLYGPVEQFFVQTYQPNAIVCERHPVVESLVYGPLYVALGQDRSSTTTDDEQAVRAVLDRQAPGAMDAALAWYHHHATRLDCAGELWDVLSDVSQLVEKGPDAAIHGFAARYQATLPDDIVWLDITPQRAAQRCAARSGAGRLEVHETEERLTFLRERYLAVRDIFARYAPRTRFHAVEINDGDSVEAVLAAASAGAGLP